MYEFKQTQDGKPYIAIATADVKASLFPIDAPADPTKGSKLAYNCNLVLLKSNVGISFDVREITAEGESKGNFVAGDKSTKMNGHRAVVTKWLADRKKAVELATIPTPIYNDLMKEIKAAAEAQAAGA